MLIYMYTYMEKECGATKHSRTLGIAGTRLMAYLHIPTGGTHIPLGAPPSALKPQPQPTTLNSEP